MSKGLRCFRCLKDRLRDRLWAMSNHFYSAYIWAPNIKQSFIGSLRSITSSSSLRDEPIF